MNARTAAVAALLFALGCGNDPVPTAPNGSAMLAYSHAAVMAVAVATAHSGGGPFDNSLGCARRGVVEYSDDATGRQARFTGCDTGDNVVLDGTVAIRGRDRTTDAEQLTSLSVGGGLSLHSSAGEAVTLGAFTVTGIAFETGTSAPALRLRESSVRVGVDGATFPLEASTSAEDILDPPGIMIGSLPNPAGTPSALSETDLRRLAVYDLLVLSNLLFGETLESTRGPHVHTLPCGTVSVAPEAGPGPLLVRITNSWTSCVLAPGVLVSGNFQQSWDSFSTSRLSMRVTGPVTMGGGVPVTTFSLIEWTLTLPSSVPGNGEISGQLVAGGVTRTFRFTVALDD